MIPLRSISPLLLLPPSQTMPPEMASISVSNPSLVSHEIRPRPRPRPRRFRPPPDEKLVISRTASRRAAVATTVAGQKRGSVPRSSSLASVWREIQGSDDWKDLLKPLHPLLREEVIRYGGFVAACYKAFDLDPGSKRYSNCKYGKKSMLKEVGMEGCGYEVTKYIYATPDINIPTQTGTSRSRWIGCVAVSSDDEARQLGRRDILVSFRGTVTNTEWIANLMSSLTPARLDPQDPRLHVKVESGFLSLYTSDDSTCKFSQGSCREQLLSEVSRIIRKYKDEEMSITLAGHSMGSSLALLFGYDLAELGLNSLGPSREIPITVYSFGGPRVGNSGFKERCEELNVKVLRIVNVNDPVTKMPGVFLNESSRIIGGKYEMPWSCLCYAHVGVELALDFFKVQNPACVHDLEAYIGLLKCHKMARVRKDGKDLLSKARKFLRTQKLDAWIWQDAARQVGYLVQSLGF